MPGVEVKIAPDGEILALGPNIMKVITKEERNRRNNNQRLVTHRDIGVFDTEAIFTNHG